MSVKPTCDFIAFNASKRQSPTFRWVLCAYSRLNVALTRKARGIHQRVEALKRFTETNKWDDPWFMRLPPSLKCLWGYICDRCDASGVIDFCAELASVQIGDQFADDALLQFGDRVTRLESGKWQIVQFLTFQYGTVDANCPAHKPVIRLIFSNGLKYPINNLSDRVLNTPKEKSKDKDKSTDKKEEESEKKPNLTPTPEDIYDAYPRHEKRPQGISAIEKALMKFPADFVLERTKLYASTQPPRSRFTPLPASWFNAERFNDDPSEWSRNEGNESKPKKPWDTIPKPKPNFGELYGT